MNVMDFVRATAGTMSAGGIEVLMGLDGKSYVSADIFQHWLVTLEKWIVEPEYPPEYDNIELNWGIARELIEKTDETAAASPESVKLLRELKAKPEDGTAFNLVVQLPRDTERVAFLVDTEQPRLYVVSWLDAVNRVFVGVWEPFLPDERTAK